MAGTQTKLGANQHKILDLLKTRAMTYIELKEKSGIRLEFHSAFDGLKRRGRITQSVTGKYRSDQTPVETDLELRQTISEQNTLIKDLLDKGLTDAAKFETLKHEMGLIITAWTAVEQLAPGKAKALSYAKFQALMNRVVEEHS